MEFFIFYSRCRFHKALLGVLLSLAMGASFAHAAESTSDQGQHSWRRLAQHVEHHASNATETAKKLKANARLSQLSLADLGKIEVTTASKEPEEVRRIPAAIYVLTQEDIRRSGATSIPELLRLVPGVEVARIDSDHWAVGVRGFGNGFSKSVLVLIDGRSVYSPLFAGVYWEVQGTPIEDIERIEVIRGPGGTIWGANAVDGVINIITKKAKDTHGTLVTAGGGNVDEGTGGVHYGGGNGKGFNYRVYGMGFDRGPEFHADHDPFDEWRTGQAGFRADWEPQGADTVTLQGDIYKGGDGERVSIAYYTPPSQSNVDGLDKVSGGNLLWRWKRTLGEGSDIQVQAYFDNTKRLGPQYGENRNTFDIDFLHHLTLPYRQNFLWGLGARWSPSDFTQVVPTVDFEPHHLDDKLYSGFVQDEFELVRNHLWLTVGSKLGHNIYTGLEVQPTTRLLWTPNSKQTFWAAVTRAVRTPSRLDTDLQLTGLLLQNPLIYIEVAGNPDFNSEQLLGYEAGYRNTMTRRLYLDFSVFYNYYNDLNSYGTASIIGAALPPPPHFVLIFPYANALRGKTDGFEVAPVWTLSHRWQLKGSYSYLHMNLESKPGFSDESEAISTEGSSPRHEVTFQSLVNLPKHFEFDQTYRYVSALPALSVPGYNTADVRLGWRPGRHWEFSVSGQNLLQPRHMEFISDPGLPVEIRRDAYGKITFRW